MTTEIITSSRTWTCPAGVTKASVSIYGGGGKGYNGEPYLGTRNGYSGYGGSASTPVTSDITLAPGQTYALIVGGPGGVSSGFGQTGDPGADGYDYTDSSAKNGGNGYGSAVSGSDGNPPGGYGGTGYGAGGGGGRGGTESTPAGTGGFGAQGVIVISYTLPTASISPSPSSGNAPLAVSFTGTVTGSPTAYDWDFGDGSSHGSTQNASHTYSLTGTYSVTYTVYNDYGYVTATATIRVYWKPGARVTIISAEPWRH